VGRMTQRPRGTGSRYMARPTRFERVTAWFVARYSIQLSYGRVEGRYDREKPNCSQGHRKGFRGGTAQSSVSYLPQCSLGVEAKDYL
jgi:hypothetical protein